MQHGGVRGNKSSIHTCAGEWGVTPGSRIFEPWGTLLHQRRGPTLCLVPGTPDLALILQVHKMHCIVFRICCLKFRWRLITPPHEMGAHIDERNFQQYSCFPPTSGNETQAGSLPRRKTLSRPCKMISARGQKQLLYAEMHQDLT